MQVPCRFNDYVRLVYWVPHLERLASDPEDKASLRQILMFLQNGGIAARFLETGEEDYFLKLNPRQFRALLKALQVHGAEIPDRNGEEAASNVRSYTRYLEAVARGEDAAAPDYLADYR